MTEYQNKSHRSGIKAFEIDKQNIRIEFSNGAVYEYSFSSAGKDNIRIMKSLAKAGWGLNRFINEMVWN